MACLDYGFVELVLHKEQIEQFKDGGSPAQFAGEYVAALTVS
jgi:hypothetical protein